MKNLKMFAIGLVAFAAMTMGVHANNTCYLPGEDESSAPVKCQAKVGTVGYDDVQTALSHALNNGGELVLYKDASINAVNNVSKNLTIDLGGYKLTIAKDLGVLDGGSITIKGAGEIIASSGSSVFVVNKGGKLSIDDATITGANNNIIITAKGGEVSLGSNVAIDATQSKLVDIASHDSVVTLNGKTIKVNQILTVSAPVSAANAAKVTIDGGRYVVNATGSDDAIVADNGVILTVKGATVEVKGNSYPLYVNNAVVTVDGATLTADDVDAIMVTGTSEDAKLTIMNGTFTSKKEGEYALYLNNPNATYSVLNGTFESKGGDKTAAIFVATALTNTDKNGNTTVKDNIKGILEGGRYLNAIVAKTLNGSNGTIDLSTELVKAGLTVTEEGNYKVINAASKGDDEQNAGDANTPSDTTNPNVPNVPKTSDSILVYAGLGIVSALSVGFASRRKENN